MNPSAGRILTTHSGSLPRPLGFLPVLLARDAGQANDAEFFDATRAAVQETVQREADAGVDVLNDGEMSKPSYATYVKDRLTGFGGQGSMQNVRGQIAVLEDFPDFAEKRAQAARPCPRSSSPPVTGRSATPARTRCRPTSRT